jgi:hypothetical protein
MVVAQHVGQQQPGVERGRRGAVELGAAVAPRLADGDHKSRQPPACARRGSRLLIVLNDPQIGQIWQILRKKLSRKDAKYAKSRSFWTLRTLRLCVS